MSERQRRRAGGQHSPGHFVTCPHPLCGVLGDACPICQGDGCATEGKIAEYGEDEDTCRPELT